MTTEWTPTETPAEPNKLVDADELSRAVSHVKAWFAAELERLTGPKEVPVREDIPMPGTVVASGDDMHQMGTVDHSSDV